jgi:hypothetical protein
MQRSMRCFSQATAFSAIAKISFWGMSSKAIVDLPEDYESKRLPLGKEPGRKG